MGMTKAMPGASFLKETVGGRWHYWRARVGKKLTGGGFRSEVANTRTSALVESGYGQSACVRTGYDCLGNLGRIHAIRRSLAR
jgi:hypothetical protein